jgi:hypothetical protein
MDWKEEMKMGMLMIQSACQKNPIWNDCHECPFDEFCDYIYVETSQFPDEWNLESED